MFRWLFNKEQKSIKSDDDFIIIEMKDVEMKDVELKDVETKDYVCRFFTDNNIEIIKENYPNEDPNEAPNEESDKIIPKLKTQLDSRIDPVIFVPGHPFEIIPNYEEDELENIFRKTIGFLFNRFTNIMVEEFTNDHFTA